MIKSSIPLRESIAPYNFVSLNKRVLERYDSKEKLPRHGRMYRQEEGFYNGYVDYVIEALSPIMICGENKEFFKNQNNKYAIPASTLRGLIKNNLSILSLSSPVNDIKDTLFLYRALASKNKKLKLQYNETIDISLVNKMPGKVQAGYVYKDVSGKYIIVPAKHVKGKTFYSISESNLRRMNVNSGSIKYMYTKRILDFEVDKTRNKYAEKNRWYAYIKSCQNGSDYSPYCTQISYDIKQLEDGSSKVSKIDGDMEALGKKGFLLCSGFVPRKSSHYLINEIDKDSEKIELTTEEVRSYKDNLTIKEKKDDLPIKKDKAKFYKLPEEVGEMYAKPIFFAKSDKYTYFGFTPYLRIFYNGSIHDGIPKILKEEVIDYQKALFGFANNEESYKSRLSFMEAEESTGATLDTEKTVILGEPKATCYPDYINQPLNDKKDLLTYNDKGDFTIRGIKQYWIKDEIMDCELNKNTDVNVKFTPLKSKAKFNGRVYFNNLNKDELGLLLWAIKLNEGCKQNIGLAKPFGYGKVQVQDVRLSIENLEEKYRGFTFDFYDDETSKIDEYIDFYKNYVVKRFDCNKIDNYISIREFFIMKTLSLSNEESRYMTLSYPAEFSQGVVLPTALEMGKRKNSIYARGIIKASDDLQKEDTDEKESKNVYDGPAVSEDLLKKLLEKNSSNYSQTSNKNSKKNRKR